VQASEIQQLLQSKSLYPKDKPVKDINTNLIEQCVASFNPVRTAQCYKTNNGDVHIRITLRQPLVRVVSETDSYFIDSDRKRMEIRASVKQDIPVLTGRVSEKTAAAEMTDFILWLQKDKFWGERLGSISVNNKQQVIIHQPNGQPSIVIGLLSDYKRKLKRARTYMENAETMSLPAYKEIDVQFEGQVIGRS
jgi:cell division protein FtsQ